MMPITAGGNDRRCRDAARWNVGRATAVRRCIGAGIEKTFYENPLVLVLRMAGLAVEWQATVPVGYQVIGMNAIDLLVADCLFFELKAAQSLRPMRSSCDGGRPASGWPISSGTPGVPMRHSVFCSSGRVEYRGRSSV
jgi:GxxExxY protein